MSVDESLCAWDGEGEGFGTFPVQCRHRACWAAAMVATTTTSQDQCGWAAGGVRGSAGGVAAVGNGEHLKNPFSSPRQLSSVLGSGW